MSDDRTIAALERIAVLLLDLDNRLARIERVMAPPLYKIAEDGVLTRITERAQVTNGSKIIAGLRDAAAHAHGDDAAVPTVTPLRNGAPPR